MRILSSHLASLVYPVLFLFSINLPFTYAASNVALEAYSNPPLDLFDIIKQFSLNPASKVPADIENRLGVLEWEWSQLGNETTTGKIEVGDAKVLDILSEYYYIFDEMLFFGQVASFCTLQMASEERAGAFAWTNVYRPSPEVKDPRSIFGRETCTINLKDIAAVYSERPRDAQLQHYQEILVHEMIHAYLYLYSCDSSCAECTHGSEIYGGDGHGFYFQKIAQHIREKGLPTLFRSSFNLDGAWDLAWDCVNTDAEDMPSACVQSERLQELGLSSDDVEEAYKHVQEEGSQHRRYSEEMKRISGILDRLSQDITQDECDSLNQELLVESPTLIGWTITSDGVFIGEITP